MRRRPSLVVPTVLASVVAGCGRDPGGQAAVLYCSVDETFARQVIDRYREATGRRVMLVTDTEAGKTTGLVKRIRLEQDRPRADVLWSSEHSQTVLLARDGLLAPYDSPTAGDIPSAFVDARKRWTGFALRARAVAYDPERTDPDALPRTWEELAEPRFARDLAVANPLFGTTRAHVSAMHAVWGPDRFREFLDSLVKHGVRVLESNSATVRAVIAGDVRYGLTDSDDVLTAQRRGHSVSMFFPDMGGGGTLVIPNTVALLAGAPHPDAGRRLIDFLLSAEVERMLARSDSGNYPVRAALAEELGRRSPPSSIVDPDSMADAMQPALAVCREILLQ